MMDQLQQANRQFQINAKMKGTISYHFNNFTALSTIILPFYSFLKSESVAVSWAQLSAVSSESNFEANGCRSFLIENWNGRITDFFFKPYFRLGEENDP
jgi:hypothetical protein